MQVHPLYDIEELVWVTESGITARTLRELQAKLPRVSIVGYFPDGFDVIPRSPLGEGPVRSIFRSNYSANITSVKAKRIDAELAQKQTKEEEAFYARQKREYEKVQNAPEPKSFVPKPARNVQQENAKVEERSRMLHNLYGTPRCEAILNLAAKGQSQLSIARELNLGESTVYNYVMVGKLADDKRAFISVTKKKKTSVRWSLQTDAELEKLVDQGLSAGSIAEELGDGLTRNAIIGRCHRLKLQLQGRDGPKRK